MLVSAIAELACSAPDSRSEAAAASFVLTKALAVPESMDELVSVTPIAGGLTTNDANGVAATVK